MGSSDQDQSGDTSLEPDATTTTQALALLDAVESSAAFAVGLTDSEGRYLRANKTLAALTGRIPEKLIGITIAELNPEFWDRLEPVFRHVTTTGETAHNLPVYMGSRDGTGGAPQWIFSYDPVALGDGTTGVALTGVDVTERVRTEELIAAAMNEVADGVIIEDRIGLTYMNRAASRMLGWTEGELRGRRTHDVIHYQRADGSPISFDECVFHARLADGRLQRVSHETFTRKNGTTFSFAASVVPLYVGSRVDRFVAVFRDLSAPARAFIDPIRILIAAAEPSTSRALQAAFAGQEDVAVVSIVTSAAAAVSAAQRLGPDIALVGEELADVEGVRIAQRINAKAPATSVIFLTGDVDESVAIGSIAAGATGALDKARIATDALGAVRAAYQGEMPVSQPELQQQLTTVRRRHMPALAADLTAREREVLGCIMQGLSNPAAAERLGVTTNTIRNHVQRVLWKLNVHSKLEAVVVATREGLLQNER